MTETDVPKIIELKLHLDPALPPVLADANQSNQALLNICLNARDAMPMSGVLAFTTQVIEGSELRDRHAGARTGRYVCIAIADNGTGMEEDVRLRIFEPFSTTKGFGEGTGLGLAMVYGLIRNHNGLIDVESEPEHGTTFRLYLPRARSRIEAGCRRANGKGSTAARKDSTSRDGSRCRRRSGDGASFEKPSAAGRLPGLAAADGEEAMELYEVHKEDVDIALVDLNLPKGWPDWIAARCARD